MCVGGLRIIVTFVRECELYFVYINIMVDYLCIV